MDIAENKNLFLFRRLIPDCTILCLVCRLRYIYVFGICVRRNKKDKLIKQQFVLKRVFAKIVFKVARSGLFKKKHYCN